MRGNKREAGHGSFRVSGLVTVAGAVMMLLAIGTMGCGGGGNSGVAPFAGVWVANSMVPTDALHFPGTDFVIAGAFPFPPIPRLTSPFVAPQDTLFRPGNNFWVVDGGNGRGFGAAVSRFLFNQVASLNTTPAPAPNLILKALVGPVNFQFPQFAAFDAAGNLWVSDSAANAIFKFSRAQLLLASGIGLTPAAVLTNGRVGPQAFSAPLGIAFDSAGNLWVANNFAGPLVVSNIVEISQTALSVAAGVTPVLPRTVLNSRPVPGGLPSIANPWGILFDSSGNMWFTNEQLAVSGCSGTVVKFAAGSFTGLGSVSPAPAVVIGQTAVGGSSSLCDPNGITMNRAGNIVVANAAGNSLAEYTASQITSSGNPTPHTFVVGLATLLNGPAGLTYGPVSLK